MSPSFPLYQIDAFTDEPFKGNPAAVVPLEHWPEEDVLQHIATENNLSETAYFVAEDGGYRLRWFTPRCEVALCGHATLASAYVILNELKPERQELTFHSRSGPLYARREGPLLSLDFPAIGLRAVTDPPDALFEGLRSEPEHVFETGNDNFFAVYSSEREIASLKPNLDLLETLPADGVVVTAPGANSDCASRYFAPRLGVPEDPVTGSIHCAVVPFWAERLGQSTVHARQISKRGGELFCKDNGERVILSGHAVKYLEATIYL